MMKKRAILCAISLLIAASGPLWAAQAAKKRGEAKPRGKTETLACRLGTEDRHARIAVVVIGGKTDSFAYYSKWKPRTCSVYLQRNRDMYSKWADSGNITTVSLDKGAFLIEHKPGEYHFIFRDIDRERYCGMDGVINGSLTIKRGSDQCILDGELMVEGTPLGEAHIARQDDKPPPGMMPDLGPEAGTAKPAAAAEAAKPAAAVPGKPTAAPPAAAAAPAAPAAIAPAAAVPAAPAAAPAAPSAASVDKPTASTPAEGPAKAEGGSAPAGAAPAAAPGAQPAASEAPRVADKPADASSGNPLSGFFRSMRPGTPPIAPKP